MANDQTRPSGTPIPIEEIVAEAPLVVRRYVKWGEVDFAHVAYTGKFLDWVLESAELWFKRTMGESWAGFNGKRGVTLPAMGCSLDFHHMLKPDDEINMTVLLDRIGRSSHTLRIVARNQDGVHCFDGTLTFAAVDPEIEKSVPMPQELKDRMAAYKAACEGRG
jgi:4-hydroxybenzoyl-CoA thioesterase